MKQKLLGSLYLAVGVLIILTEVYKGTHTDSPNWFQYILGISFILIGIIRLGSKPTVK